MQEQGLQARLYRGILRPVMTVLKASNKFKGYGLTLTWVARVSSDKNWFYLVGYHKLLFGSSSCL